jgi:cobalt-zinc-cadmium efflux system protein
MHSHSHKKSKSHSSSESNIKIAILLNASFTIIELVGGILTNSMAILSDALHDLGDTITLSSSYFFERAAHRKKSDDKRTFGYQRLSLLSAIINAVVLIGGSLFILNETVGRLFTPEHVNAQGMMVLAIIGIAFNALGSWRLSRGTSANEKILTWHLLEDVLGWGVILIGSIIMQFWDNHYIDPIMTIAFSLFILWGVVRGLREVFNIFLQGVPSHIDSNQVKEAVLSVDGVIGIHDVHIWSLEGETDILTAHVVIEDDRIGESNSIKQKIKEELKHRHVEHSTLEFESSGLCSGTECE